MPKVTCTKTENKNIAIQNTRYLKYCKYGNRISDLQCTLELVCCRYPGIPTFNVTFNQRAQSSELSHHSRFILWGHKLAHQNNKLTKSSSPNQIKQQIDINSKVFWNTSKSRLGCMKNLILTQKIRKSNQTDLSCTWCPLFQWLALPWYIGNIYIYNQSPQYNLKNQNHDHVHLSWASWLSW